jgi:hypothetical protein
MSAPDVLREACLAYLEDMTGEHWEKFSHGFLVEHLASLFGVPRADLERELELRNVVKLADYVRAGDYPMADAVEDVSL